jgi:hypothetical protein
MAESRTLLGKWNDRRSTLAGGLGKPRSFDSAVPITALLNILVPGTTGLLATLGAPVVFKKESRMAGLCTSFTGYFTISSTKKIEPLTHSMKLGGCRVVEQIVYGFTRKYISEPGTYK